MTNKMKVLLYCYIHSLLLLIYPILLTGQGKTTVKLLKHVKAEIGQTVTLKCSGNREDGTFSVTWTENCGNNSLGQGPNKNRMTSSTYGDQHMKVIILGCIAGFELCVIIVLLAALIKCCHQGTHVTKDKVNEEEKTEGDQSLHYAEILTKKATRHPRTRHTEDVITYATIKTQ
ncbi:uncharacterized protein [Aquarana catesbeiana]|uniref:uncharacterized protein isoform X2 n=1 Tax=Aquarana catesbeiana TaxID=8400 RepID=UPI003CCA1938